MYEMEQATIDNLDDGLDNIGEDGQKNNNNGITSPPPEKKSKKVKDYPLVVDFARYDDLEEKRNEKIILIESNGRKVQQIELQELLALGKNVKENSKHTFFVDVQFPTAAALREIGRVFDLHPLTVEDCFSSAETREKNEIFDNYRFVVMTEVHVPPGTNELLQVNVNLIVFKNFLICVHQGPIKCIDQVLNRMRMLKEGMKRTADWIMYAILDAIVDMFFSFVQHIGMEVDSLDDLVLILTAHEQNDVLKRIGLARKRISFLRAQLLKKKDVMVSLMIKSGLTEDEPESKHTSEQQQQHDQQHEDSPTLEKFDALHKHRAFGALNRNTKIYLRDVLDHIQAMLEDIEATKETLSNLNSTYLARVDIEVAYSSNRMDSVMKKFGAMTTIMLPLTFITGLWGMNVTVPGQPDTADYTWFYVILGGMAAYSAIVIILFKKYHWF